ncbi:RNA 2',3'-cyclic phosphodiesterase [Candidatus Pacearchaeota archaeon CG_4_10_14_0_2_um_filter_35_33]|nr:MAG: 2'-5' RNA ligase [Candidatus Pacearchaeota archaeon CG1_02_35_32]PIZ80770.1 MAG: RNA 2',3'-cyclic phosphodiesterase [Candidatus Pacearchaeota archaeon CG_4_10_14_0_2_um_filter_35_33]PJA69866.1 MAG: RNA 2',3'-cyclic phosphodiesterase [Candidatus Pacearchaeota archaeon CG_4_9_14_3_um_filter_35_19]PJB93768.1 MAG: RNA 2',3'-cyclic phosphodiesterase [Candidatus Pacearchaeota archaeon CG_4_9_14_0_8_um_filter_35_24]
MNTTRTFICIDFPSEIIKEITRVQGLIKRKKFTGKLTKPENLHLTLKFLGNINEEVLKKVQTQLSKIKFPQLECRLVQTGTFNYKLRPRIAWIKILGLNKLQKQIDTTIDSFPQEKRFMSHLTIARIKYTKTPKELINHISQIKTKPLKFQINEFKIKSSELKSPTPIYKTLETYQSTPPTKPKQK